MDIGFTSGLEFWIMQAGMEIFSSNHTSYSKCFQMQNPLESAQQGNKGRAARGAKENKSKFAQFGQYSCIMSGKS